MVQFASEKQWTLYTYGNDERLKLQFDSGRSLYYDVFLEKTLRINFTINDFIQANTVVNRKMIAQVLDWV